MLIFSQECQREKQNLINRPAETLIISSQTTKLLHVKPNIMHEDTVPCYTDVATALKTLWLCSFKGAEVKVQHKIQIWKHIKMHYFQKDSTGFVILNVPLISHEFSVNVKWNRELSMYVICKSSSFFPILIIFVEILRVLRILS